MTLLQILAALSGNTDHNISIVNSDDTALITFNAAGYESIENDLTARTVKRVRVDSNHNLIKVVIEDADSGSD